MKQENYQQIINCLIVHYNTPELTEACIKSINKHTPGCKIFIFDNSDKRPFTAFFDNIEIIDNTKGQIIDFDKWLEQFQNKDEGTKKCNNFASAKHSISIQKFIELKNIPFILLDSDVLIKKDLSDIINLNYVCVGEISDDEKRGINRLLPFVCFINSPILKTNYFDPNRCVGFKSIDGKFWDTGASFLFNLISNKQEIKNVSLKDYYVHFGAGSWYTMDRKRAKHIPCSPEQWLKQNKDLWENI